MLVHELSGIGAPDDIVIIDGTKELTYGDFKAAITTCRNYLYSEGVRQHDRVAIYSRNCAEFVISYYAITSLGAIAVPINFQLSMRETAFILKNAEIHHIITYKKLDLDAAINLHDYDGAVKQLDIANIASHTDIPSAPALPDNFSENEFAAIIYTSGTTGNPKGAVLSHKNLVSNAINYEAVLGTKSTDRILCVLPMYHCFAWTCAVMGPISRGASLVILDSFTPKETIAAIQEKHITSLVAVPSICALLAKLAPSEALKNVWNTISGGTTLPLQIANDFTAKFGVHIQEGYGLSECSPVVTVNPVDKIVVGSIGKPLPNTVVKIVRSDGTEADIDEAGEMLVQSPSVMRGYWKMPDASAETLKDGWLHTGDVAKIDKDGNIYIVDRIKDMIISMGENIYPREIEELLYSFPGIKEAAVIGIPDALRGQAGCCYFTIQDDAEINIRALKKYLQQNLALYKIPREFHKLDELPKTSTGKIAKKDLQKIYTEKN